MNKHIITAIAFAIGIPFGKVSSGDDELIGDGGITINIGKDKVSENIYEEVTDWTLMIDHEVALTQPNTTLKNMVLHSLNIFEDKNDPKRRIYDMNTGDPDIIKVNLNRITIMKT